jgi:hypothetical protein
MNGIRERVVLVTKSCVLHVLVEVKPHVGDTALSFAAEGQEYLQPGRFSILGVMVCHTPPPILQPPSRRASSSTQTSSFWKRVKGPTVITELTQF